MTLKEILIRDVLKLEANLRAASRREEKIQSEILRIRLEYESLKETFPTQTARRMNVIRQHSFR